jgi:hypothetical protein
MQAHALSAVLPGGECEFAGQLKQEPTAEAARVVEYVPAPQSRHVEAPVIILYFPASHAAHIPPSGPVYPGLHRQLVRRLLPLGETECSGQLSHTSTSAEPKTALYVQAPQSIQLPAAEAPVLVRYLPASQLVQVLSKEAPAAVEYLPLPQSVQDSLPCVALYPPASHAAHVPPSGPVYPGSHRQLVRRLLPLGETECSGQLSHTSTSAEPKTALYVQAPQSVQLLAAEAPVLVRYLPASQLVQVLSKEAPAAVEYLPLPQSVQDSLPCVALYPPASHATHVPPSGPVYPGSHRQLVPTLLPLGELELSGQDLHVLSESAPVVVENLPASQSVHTAEPIPFLYLPATHAEQDPPSNPVNPELQRQLVERILPIEDTEFDEQLTQVEDAVAPVVAENLPAIQSVHATVPFAALYFPARHNSHVSPSGPVAPALQVQCVRRVDLEGEFEFVGQRLQVGLPSSDHVPSEHGWHVSTSVAPSAVEYNPPAHMEHS